MVYLDYSATTPVDKEVLDTFNKACNEYWANPNSMHDIGVKAKKLIDASTNQIASILGVKPNEVIYTSGASEANNLAIKGIADKYQNRGKHIITTNFEHSSVLGPVGYLQKKGFDIDFIETDENGNVDLNLLESMIREDTILVSITAVNSEIGIVQNIEEIGKLLKKYPKLFFHTDITQAVGKIKIDLTNVDLASLSAQKFFGIKGVGALIKKENIAIEPIIHGGKSTTVYRSGTPATQLIASMSKAMRLVNENIDEHYAYVSELNKELRTKLSNYEKVSINSPKDALPYILNISVIGVKPEVLQHALEKYEIYISTQTACATKNSYSASVMALTHSQEKASSSVRISLSYKTTIDEIEEFITKFDKCYNELTNIRGEK